MYLKFARYVPEACTLCSKHSHLVFRTFAPKKGQQGVIQEVRESDNYIMIFNNYILTNFFCNIVYHIVELY